MGGLFAASNYHFAYKEPIRDVLHLHEARTFREVALLDCRSKNDSPPGGNRGVPRDLAGVNNLFGDLEFTADGKTLVTVRSAHQEWKPIVRNGIAGGWMGKSREQITFWDVDKGTATGTLDCEDEQASDGHLTLLPRRKWMLVRFANGVRMLDLETRKWGAIFTIKNPIKGHTNKIASAAFSVDEKKVVVADHMQTIRVFDLDTGKQEQSFRVRALNRQADDNPPGNGLQAYGPHAVFTADGKVLRVTLNDFRTVVYHDAATGAVVKKPASEAMKFPGGPAIALALSRDRRYAITAPTRTGTHCTVWVRGGGKE
jgi:WD40 repeat protein